MKWTTNPNCCKRLQRFILKNDKGRLSLLYHSFEIVSLLPSKVVMAGIPGVEGSVRHLKTTISKGQA